MPEQPFFDEDPFSRITDVHWPPSECPEPPDNYFSQPNYTGYYGAGSYLDPAGVIVPFGPNQYPPFVGEVEMQADNKVGELDCGGVGSGSVPEKWKPTMLAGGEDRAYSLLIDQHNSLVFGTYRFFFEAEGSPIFWTVPMAYGQTYYGMFGSCQPVSCPWVVQTFTIGAAWNFPNSTPGTYGVGFSHTQNPPEEPQFTVGARAGGRFEITYDYKFWDFWEGTFTGKYKGFTQQGQWDLSLGGPLYFFLYVKNPDFPVWDLLEGGDWFATHLRLADDYFAWWVYARGGLAFPPPGNPVEPGDPVPTDDGYPGSGPPTPPPRPPMPLPGDQPPGRVWSDQSLRLLRERAAPLLAGGAPALVTPRRLVTPRLKLI